MEWYCVLGLSASLLAGRTTNVPKGCPLVRGNCQPLNTRTLRPLMAFSSDITSPLLAAVQSQRWVQCRSLSLTLKWFSYKDKIHIPWKNQEIRPTKLVKHKIKQTRLNTSFPTTQISLFKQTI